MKFAANNRYATDTSTGFYNTWYVLAFEDRKSRDEYVAKAKGLAAKAITKAAIRRYVKAPKPIAGYQQKRDRTQRLLNELERAAVRQHPLT